MRLAPFGILALVAASTAVAQTKPQPTIALTIGGGVVTGHGLWTIGKQPVCLLTGGGSCSGQYDTLRIARSISSSLVVGASGTYFPWPHVGLHAEVSYVGFPFDDSCVGLFFNPDVPDERARQMCDNLSSARGTGGAISLFVGATVRAVARGSISPYVRASAGIVNMSSSTVEVVGAYVDGTGGHERLLIGGGSGGGTSPMLGVAAGFTSPIGSGYQFRLEVRDMLASFDRITGPANNLAVAPVASRFYHHFALVLGLDVVLERKRGRRY